MHSGANGEVLGVFEIASSLCESLAMTVSFCHYEPAYSGRGNLGMMFMMRIATMIFSLPLQLSNIDNK